jgi:hypothetical protein
LAWFFTAHNGVDWRGGEGIGTEWIGSVLYPDTKEWRGSEGTGKDQTGRDWKGEDWFFALTQRSGVEV